MIHRASVLAICHLFHDPTQTAEQIIGHEISRWSLEVMFEESCAHLWIKTQRQWSDRAIERSTPLLFGLSSLVALFVTHNELFPIVKALMAVACEFFDRYNRNPSRNMAVIGSHVQIVI
jgi:hypothetical protein